MKPSEKLFNKYEYLARKYSNKIFSYQEISFEYEDLLQEFRLKIFTSIKAYGRRWARYRRGEASRPVPIRYYLECACGNKMRDFMKYISRENRISIEDIDFDYGVEQDSSICVEKNRFLVRGVDLLEGLKGKERAAFTLFLKGYDARFIRKMYDDKKVADVKQMIDLQRERLIRRHGSELMQSRRVYMSYSLEED